MNLTDAQREVLQHATKRLARSTVTGDAWATDVRGYTVRVRRATFNKLLQMGLIRLTYTDSSTEAYSVTEDGRAALQEVHE